MLQGRATQTKKSLIRALLANLGAIDLATRDVEITIAETPRANGGIRGKLGDELDLGYKVEV